MELDLLMEARKRGILPDETAALVDEAQKRGMIPSGDLSQVSSANRLIDRGIIPNPASDPTHGMKQPELVRAGAGKFVSDVGFGLEQAAGKATPEDVDERRKLDAPLMNRGAAQFGNAGMATISSLPLSFLPGANTVPGAMLYGSLMGAGMPTGTGESTIGNAARTGLAAGGGQLLGRLLGGPIQNRNPAATQNLVDTATGKYGIDLPTSTRTGSKPMAYFESQLATMPGGGRMADALRRPNEQYSAALMKEAGGNGLATEATLKGAERGTAATYTDIWARNSVKTDQQFVNDLVAAEARADRMLTPAKAAIVKRQIDNILSKVDQNGIIDGNIYQSALRPELRSVTKSDSSLEAPLRDVKKALDSAAQRSISSQDSGALSEANRQYALQKALRDRVLKAESRGGTFTPSDAQTAVGDFGGNVGELAKIGPLLREPPNSGTATRQLTASLLLGGVPGGVGYATGGPEDAAKYGAAGMVAPWAASQFLSRPGAQKYLANGAFPMPSRTQALLAAALRSAAMGSSQLIQSKQ